MKHVLVFHISEFSGHKKAADAIEEAIKYISGNSARVTNLDALRFFHPYACNIINTMYLGLIRKAPFIWGAIYDKPSIAKALDPVKDFLHANKMKMLNKLFSDGHPSAVVCTQAFPCGIVAEFKKEYMVNIPLIAVVTDFYPHRFWIYDEVDYYIVSTDEGRHKLNLLGVSNERIKTFGIPISLKFVNFNII